MIASTFASKEGNRCAAGNRRHCYTCFPLPGATKGGTYARRGSVYSRGLAAPKESRRPQAIGVDGSHTDGLARAPTDARVRAIFNLWWCAATIWGPGVRMFSDACQTKRARECPFTIHK